LAKVFISYRREDSEWQAHEIYAAILRTSGANKADVFIDVDAVPLGVNFRDYIDAKVADADVLLALIGRHWLDARNPTTGSQRLHDPDDFVRIEIASALRRKIKVIPIFLDGAKLPDDDHLPEELRELRFRNGIEVTRQSFDSDVKRLLSGLSLYPQAAHQTPTATGGSDADDVLVVTTSDAGFEGDVVLKSNSIPVIAFFGAPWCGVCAFIRPQLERAVRQENGAVRLSLIDVDESPVVPRQLNIRGVPTVYAYYQGHPVAGFVGRKTAEEIRSFVSDQAARIVRD
jgi:thiol-disulfide isomerase/thioredoxin